MNDTNEDDLPAATTVDVVVVAVDDDQDNPIASPEEIKTATQLVNEMQELASGLIDEERTEDSDLQPAATLKDVVEVVAEVEGHPTPIESTLLAIMQDQADRASYSHDIMKKRLEDKNRRIAALEAEIEDLLPHKAATVALYKAIGMLEYRYNRYSSA